MKRDVIERIMKRVKDADIFRDLVFEELIPESARDAMREILEAELAPMVVWTTEPVVEVGDYLIRKEKRNITIKVVHLVKGCWREEGDRYERSSRPIDMPEDE